MKPGVPNARKLFVLANALMAILAVLITAGLIRALVFSHPLPPPPTRDTRREAAPERVGPRRAVRDDEGFERFRVIVDRPLFNPSRREPKPAEAVAPAAPLPPPPTLYGVVLDGERARAYLGDRGSARVLSYRVGDTVAGGVIEAIGKDRVSISRAGVKLRVMLIHPAAGPSEPKPGSKVRADSAAGKLPALPALDARGRKSWSQRWGRLPGRGSGTGFLPGQP